MKISIILVEPENPGNIGAIARVMKNFGAKELILINPCRITEEAYVRAKHAKDILEKAKIKKKFETKGFDVLVGTSAKKGGRGNVNRIFLHPKELEGRIGGRVGVVFGRESTGLKNEELKKCDLVVNIPANPAYPVLNISHACAIILYELYEKHAKRNIAGEKEKKAVFLLLDRIIEKMGKRNKKKEINMKIVMKRIISRAGLTKKEVFTIAGFLRNIMNMAERKK